ncbi:MAG: sulfurtransferase [Planctomycetes bacterium]|nr:sulfurtransferase [Planctomycetota bacterium]MCB9911107.1 sulfurtransferase [Planctomycetota bacterium]MCB9912160.1 sulfurtransferase [Planctomycetota bacterium]HPF15790.1 rhodanese-like domain-containing protein [Planctomycetota bacterium]HRV81380.1 rhodanese-like domain-containing protein [Planctomycetota bacterium]
MKPLRPSELAERLQRGDKLVLLDVRQPGELEICCLPQVVAIPLGELTARYQELDPEAEIVCICHHGIRSARAAGFLAQVGFERIHNLTGGIDAWACEVDPKMARY